MPASNRNRYGQKEYNKEDRTGNNTPEKTGYRKLPDNLTNKPDKSISTTDNTANGKYSRTRKRKDEINKEETRGGR